MKIDWVIENWAKEKSYIELRQAIVDLGHTVTDLRDYRVSDWDNWKNKCVVFQGSINMAKMMRNALQECSPVVWSTSENYLCSKYYSRYSNLLFNDKYALVSFSNLVFNKFFYYATFGKEANIFLRPDSGDKPFTARLMDLQDIDKFYQADPIIHNDLVLISTPKTIRGEYRFIVSDQQEIIAHSTYQYQGLSTLIPAVPIGATKKCQEVLETGYAPDPVFCIDICEDTDGNFWLLELNSFSSCGLYASNKKKIVERVSEIAWDCFKKTIDNPPNPC